MLRKNKQTSIIVCGLAGLLAMVSACDSDKPKTSPSTSGSGSGGPVNTGVSGNTGTGTGSQTQNGLPSKCEGVPTDKCDSVLGCAKSGDTCGDDSSLETTNCGDKSSEDCQKASYCQYSSLIDKCFDIENAQMGECQLKDYTALVTECTSHNADSAACGNVKVGGNALCAHTAGTAEACVPNSAFGGTTLKDACSFLAKTGGTGLHSNANCTAALIVLKPAASSNAVVDQIAAGQAAQICDLVGNVCSGYSNAGNALGDLSASQGAADAASVSTYCTNLFNNAKAAVGVSGALNISSWQANHREACEHASIVRAESRDHVAARAVLGHSLCEYKEAVPNMCSVVGTEVTRTKISALSKTDCEKYKTFLEWVSY